MKVVQRLLGCLSLCSGLLLCGTASAQVNYQLGGNAERYVVSNVQYGKLASSSTVVSDCTSCGKRSACGCESKGASGAQAQVGDMGDMGAGGAGGADLSPDLAGDLASSGFGAPSGAYSASPGMIGDFFNGGLNVQAFGQTTNVASAGGDRRFKIAENTSPFPMDRFFFNYHHFSNPVQNGASQGTDVDRFVFGLEKTFLDGMASAEIRIPFAMGLSSNQSFGVTGSANESTEFGNIVLAGKFLLLTQQTWALSAGIAASLPTAAPSAYYNNGSFVVEVDNESVHYQPFLGLALRPNSNTWVDFYTQIDVDGSGNGITLASGDTSTIRDQTLLFLDMSIGHWIYRNDCSPIVRGFAPMLELHYNRTLEKTNQFEGGSVVIRNVENRQTMLNATGGFRFLLGDSSFLTIGAVAPLLETNQSNIFDSEIAIQYTRLR